MEWTKLTDEERQSVSFSAAYLAAHGVTTGVEPFWKSETLSLRDEFFLVASLYYDSIGQIEKNKEQNEWRVSYDVAAIFLAKANAQTIRALELLVGAHCYADAFVLCRNLHSRLNLQILTALQPDLFDWWLKEPTAVIFREREMHGELENNGIPVMTHFYDLASEIAHSHASGLDATGFFNTGFFPELAPLANRIYTFAKFIIAGMAWTTICAIQVDATPTVPPEITARKALFDKLFADVLVTNRWDHVFLLMAEERHWKKIGKDKYQIGGGLNFTAIEEQMSKFHRSGQRKKLSKSYSAPKSRPPKAE